MSPKQHEMYDYWKLYIRDTVQIDKILGLPFLQYQQGHDMQSGEIIQYPITAAWQTWEVAAYSSRLLEIRGSIHKHWNRGTNENDFHHSDAIAATNEFCDLFQLDPTKAEVVNLEYAVNIYPDEDASDIIHQILCLKNMAPSEPYKRGKNMFFTEYAFEETYVKIYDKGRQFTTKNTLRFEIKSMTSRDLVSTGIAGPGMERVLLEDLLNPQTPYLLGKRLKVMFQGVAMTDDSIDNSTPMKAVDRKVFNLMKDAREWTKVKGCKTQTHRAREKRFKQIVATYGKRDLHTVVSRLIGDKVRQLCDTM